MSEEREAGRESAPPFVVMEHITKRFPGVVANDDVSLELRAGEVHALIGENGAGKSTLMRVLYGMYPADEGRIVVNGEEVKIASPRVAIKHGIGMVHQHFVLVDPFSVTENVILGDEGQAVLDMEAAHEKVATLAKTYGFQVRPSALIEDLSVGEEQRVEILKALYRGVDLLILDEPTAVLTPQEAESLFETLRVMAAEGRTIIFISHKLHEVMAVSDRVTVLRDGKTIDSVATSEATPRSLASLMVGREVSFATRVERGNEFGEPVLEVRSLWAHGDRGGDALRGIDLTLRAGEIFAIAGVAGNGQRELAEAITGMRAPTRGEIVLGGRRLRGGDAREAIRAGVAHVPEDRLHTGVAPSLSIASNFVLKAYRGKRVARGPLLKLRAIRSYAAELIGRYDVRGGGPELPARQLSGGNLQKVVLAREFEGSPRVLVVASPTRGLDVAAIETVHGYLREAAEGYVGVLLISEDLDEILALADRVAVIYEGAIVGERDARSATVQELGLLMAGGSE
jgi:general nucleoside transport system ATP-binding protein